FSLSRAKAVFIPPAKLVVVARSSYPKQNPAPGALYVQDRVIFLGIHSMCTGAANTHQNT
ncbi:hypothetical protein, partial [Faecalibacterium prausnitzii]|uniref:hypothetical protein n=1 Tax=Faecalibacterium prausnitzii TaxID=853 RepID=UPI0019D56475